MGYKNYNSSISFIDSFFFIAFKHNYDIIFLLYWIYLIINNTEMICVCAHMYQIILSNMYPLQHAHTHTHQCLEFIKCNILPFLYIGIFLYFIYLCNYLSAPTFYAFFLKKVLSHGVYLLHDKKWMSQVLVGCTMHLYNTRTNSYSDFISNTQNISCFLGIFNVSLFLCGGEVYTFCMIFSIACVCYDNL